MVDIGDEADLVPGSCEQRLQALDISKSVPLALTTFKFESNVVDGIGRSALSSLLFLLEKLLSEQVIILFFTDFIYHNLFQIIGDFVDDILEAVPAEFQFIELCDAVWIDRESAIRATD